MKTTSLFYFGLRSLSLSLLLLSSAAVIGQSYPLPTVTILATDPNASWQGDPGAFTVYRTGPITNQLGVHYSIGGTASNGVDYAQINAAVTIPVGARSADIVIKPKNLGQTQNETVVLTLIQPPFGGLMSQYVIGNPSNAAVVIHADNNTNVPPLVRITTPANGTVFRAPVDIPIVAYAHDFDGFVGSVEFFEDATSLGFGHRLVAATSVSNEYFALVWSNAPTGNFSLTAVATDNGGASTTSAPVNISIISPVPPPTNRPPVLTIVATDPIAIEGTNCWPWRGVTNTYPAWTNWTATAPIRYYTNCGPKSAVFSVNRFGATNDAITVTYQIGGTASNGVDYIPLSGSITIPAGQRRAYITVVPIDDGPPDISSTVVLSLNASTNSPIDYLLGYPHKAAALILDYPSPPPPTSVLADRSFRLNANGPNGAWFSVEVSSDLLHWTPVCTNQVVQGGIDFVDPEASDNSLRYYRTVPQASAP